MAYHIQNPFVISFSKIYHITGVFGFPFICLCLCICHLDRAGTTIIIYNNTFLKRCPYSGSLSTSIPTSEELWRPRPKKGQRVRQGPWRESCVSGPNEEAFRPQYWQDLGAVEEQRTGGSRHCFSHSVTLMCFKVKVGAKLPSLLLSFFYILPVFYVPVSYESPLMREQLL